MPRTVYTAVTRIWEYCSKDNLGDKELCDMGSEGWELVSVVAYSSWHYAQSGENLHNHRMYFKRPLAGPQQKEN